MERIDFPITGNLRPDDVLRTVYLDRDECAVRSTESAEGRNIFEMALDDYEPGCKQEVWNLSGSGVFVHRDWKDYISLPNLIVRESEEGQQNFLLASQDGTRMDEITDGRQHEIFHKILRSAQYIPMSLQQYQDWIKEYRIWTKNYPKKG